MPCPSHKEHKIVEAVVNKNWHQCRIIDMLKGTGGSKVNFFVLTYAVALVMWDQEPFTESKSLFISEI